MKGIRATAAALSSGALLSLLFATPASAQAIDAFAAQSTGTALSLKILGNGPTLGVSSSNINSEGSRANATATGIAEVAGSTRSASASGGGVDSKTDPPGACATPALPDLSAISIPPVLVFGLTAGLACGRSAEAFGGNGNPSANSRATVGAISETITITIPSTVAGVPPVVVGPIVLTRFDVGDARTAASSTGNADGGNVTTNCRVDAATVSVLDTATVGVGAATTNANYDRRTGQATASFSASPLTLNGAPVGPQGATIPIPGDVGTVTLINGSNTPPQGGFARADSGLLRVQLSPAILAPGGAALFDLSFGVCQSEVRGERRVVAAAAGELPLTGGTPWLAFAGAGVLGLAVLLRRVAVQAGR